MLNLIKSNIKDKSIVALPTLREGGVKEKKSVKHFPSAIREWNNSIYVFNKNALNLIPSTTLSAINLIKSFFNLYNSTIERKMRTKRLLLRLRRLSLNRIFVSNGEFKHTNNKVTITLYLFNRQKRSYLNRMKNLRFYFFYTPEQKNNLAKKIMRESKLKILHFLRKNLKKETTLVKVLKINELRNKSNKKENYSSITDLCNYVRIFYKKYTSKSYIYIKTFFYYKQLLFINRAKYSYTYLKHLKNILEKLFNKNVEFNLVNIKRFYLNSDILSESITIKLTKNRRKMLRYMKNIKKKIKINKKKILIIEPIFDNKKSVTIYNKEPAFALNRKNLVFSALKYKDVTGFRLEARGRLTRRYTASRSVTKIRYKGNLLNVDSSHRGLSTVLLKGNLRSNLQFTKLKSKTRIGSFGIKGWVSGN